MKINKLTEKLHDFFELPEKKKSKEKHQASLLKGITKLKKKKADIYEDIQQQVMYKGKKNKKHRELSKRYKVVSKLLQKAEKHYLEDQQK